MHDSMTYDEPFDRAFAMAEPALQEAFRGLLVAASLSDEQLAPTEALDDLLHDLLDSPRALARVEASLGCHLVHEPGLTGPPLEAAFARTVAMLTALKGEPVAVCGLKGQAVAVGGLQRQPTSVPVAG